MKSSTRIKLFVCLFSFSCLIWSEGIAQVQSARPPLILKISHQWPSGADRRDRQCHLFAKEVGERTKGALKFEIYPDSTLFKPVPQYDAMLKGTLDISIYPLDYASDKVPQFSITMMPCIIKSHPHAMRWRDAPIGRGIEKICEENGIKILTWSWGGMGLASRVKPIKLPSDMKEQRVRAAGKMFEIMFQRGPGASIATMPSNEIYAAFKTGSLDACLTSSSSFESFRLYEQVKYYTSPRFIAIGFMFEPMAMSMVNFKKLSQEHQKALLEVGAELEKFALNDAIKDDLRVTDLFKQKGIQVSDMESEDFKEWIEVSKKTAWKTFSEKVTGGRALMDLALAAR